MENKKLYIIACFLCHQKEDADNIQIVLLLVQKVLLPLYNKTLFFYRMHRQ